MPEIKNTFMAGKMNKDLDERVVPSGQYRDAQNIQVSTSEESDVGAVQNLMGNLPVNGLSGGVNTDFTAADKAYCVGSIADEKNNKLYYLVYSINADVIYELDTSGPSTTVNYVFVDVDKNVLKFDPNKNITGINIVDDLLFWTDNDGEPKKINITRCKLGSVNITTQTELFVNNTAQGISMREEHITVIKKRPTKAPTAEVIVSTRSGITSGQTREMSFSGSTGNSLFMVGELIMFSINNPGGLSFYSNVAGGGILLGDNFGPNMNINVGDVFLFSTPGTPGSLPSNFQVRIEVTEVFDVGTDDMPAGAPVEDQTYSQTFRGIIRYIFMIPILIR